MSTATKDPSRSTSLRSKVSAALVGMAKNAVFTAEQRTMIGDLVVLQNDSVQLSRADLFFAAFSH